ncbi:uncharacterized protein LOC119489820 isoform X1 [Sebastes umbrosus]|uniref:uncharacterized protein LOC119489820 isoform X1 n=1 Tax=Sebastes umbrosus TaxID=72105 RepID=UPI0018A03700|nr:uncharacterized protein LOC119489820 isoform X1 [Sebastes umbrosus]
MKSLLATLASKKLSSYAAVILIFTYTFLLGRDFECTCKPQRFQCFVYLFLPFFIILLLILLTDRSFQRVCRYLCSCAGCSRETTCNFWGSFIRHILKTALVSLLWVAFVYLDGDWYVCCENDHSEQQAPLACKAKDNITEEEQETIAELRNESRVIGVSILCGIVVVAFLIPLSRKCCEGQSSCCNRRFLFERLILEEEDDVLKDILRKSAKDQLTEEVKNRIRGGQWEKCFDVALDLINTSARSTISEEQQRLLARDADNQEDQPPGHSTGQVKYHKQFSFSSRQKVVESVQILVGRSPFSCFCISSFLFPSGCVALT